MSGQLDQWAEGFIAEVDGVWSKYPTLDAGYAVFYSPVTFNPDLMIVGFNPGGNSSSFVREKAMKLPDQHEYIQEDYLIAKKMRALFENIGKLNVLKASVKTNLIFFRSPSAQAWAHVDPTARLELEEFCGTKIKEMVTKLKPKVILAEGIETYERLKVLFCPSITEEAVVSKKRRVFISAKSSECTLLGIIHPTGSRISSSDWELIRDNLKRSLSEERI